MGRLLRLFSVLGVGVVLAASAGGAADRTSTSAKRTLIAKAKANVWIDADGGSCLRRPTRGTYVDSQACKSLQSAADAAATGDVIVIQPGRYPGQKLTGSKRLTFAATGRGRPSFGQIITSAANFTLRHVLIENRDPPAGQTICSYFDFTLFTCGANQSYDDVTVDALNKGSGDPARRGGLQVDSTSTNLVFKNGEIRGVADHKGFQGGADGMLLENNYWHDIRLTPAGGAAGVHNECAYITGGNHQTWRRNRFINCPVMAMFFANYIGGPPFSDVTVENNVFAHTLNERGGWHDGAAFVIPNGAGGQNQVNGWVVRYNTFEVPPDFGRTPETGDDNGSARFYGNLGSDGACGVPEWTYRYNVGATCGGVGEIPVRNPTNDASHPNQAPFFVNAPKGDFHLHTGAPPINRGDPDTYPARDRDGRNRLVGSAPDAGAYEFSGRGATTGILAVGDFGLGSGPPRGLGAAMRSFERANPALLAVALGNNDPTRGRSFDSSWRSAFGWLGKAGVGVAGALGKQDVAVRHGRYQFRVLKMPAAYYARRVGGVQLVVLDSTSVTGGQTRWLRRTLSRSTNLVRIVVVHDPPFACGSSLGDAAVRKQWAPLFERYGVRLVLSAGDHTYQRFAAGRVTYVVHGAAASVSRLRSCPGSYPNRGAASASRGFVYVTADAGGVLLRAVDLTGKVVDRLRVP
jgi:calcineurin-like phosphoesterase family protein